MEILKVFHGSDHIIKTPRYLGGKEDNDYGVLAWIAEVVSHRGTNQEAAAIVGTKLVEKYKIKTDSYDVIKGYRADDSYTQVIEAFLQNQINIAEMERLFYKGSLGNQIFLKSEKAFLQIKWKRSYEVVMEESYKEEDSITRREVGNFCKEEWQLFCWMDISCLGLQQAMLSTIHWFITRKAAIMSNMAYEEIYFDSMI
ncbi:MAG: DUF3990 domain-containing protein [Lachnospiraceae bacterium]